MQAKGTSQTLGSKTKLEKAIPCMPFYQPFVNSTMLSCSHSHQAIATKLRAHGVHNYKRRLTIVESSSLAACMVDLSLQPPTKQKIHLTAVTMPERMVFHSKRALSVKWGVPLNDRSGARTYGFSQRTGANR